VGLILAASSAVLTAVPGLYFALTQPPPFPYGPPGGTGLSEILPVAASFGATAGVLMLGFAALRARRWGVAGSCRWSSVSSGWFRCLIFTQPIPWGASG